MNELIDTIIFNDDLSNDEKSVLLKKIISVSHENDKFVNE